MTRSTDAAHRQRLLDIVGEPKPAKRPTPRPQDTVLEHATVNLFSVIGRGDGLTMEAAKRAANQDAGRKIRAAMTGNYHPKVISYRDLTVILWRDPLRWWYGWLKADGSIEAMGEDEDAVFVERWARMRLAKAAWNGQEEASPIILHHADAYVFQLWAQTEKRQG